MVAKSGKSSKSKITVKPKKGLIAFGNVDNTFPLSLAGIQRLNLLWFVLLAGQAVAIALLAKPRLISVTGNFQTADSLATQRGSDTLVSASTHLFDINMMYPVLVVLSLAALLHLYYATAHRLKYEKNLNQNKNLLRWEGLALIFGIIIVVIGLVSGVQDLASLVMMFVFAALLPALGIVLERMSGEVGTKRLTLAIAIKAGLMPWIVLFIYFILGDTYGIAALPTYVYWLYISVFVLISWVTLAMLAQQKQQSEWGNYLYVERYYLLLNFLIPTLFAWQLYFGLLRP